VGLVLTISPAASDAIKGLITASALPEGAGIRISGQPESAGVQLEVSLAPEAAEDDEVVEQEGANVFVESQVAPLLDNKTLDAQTQGEQVAFALVEGGPGSEGEVS
jgi:Fe-S cluster assembly iron-binding protein IscA